MEEWLHPKKWERKPKDAESKAKTPKRSKKIEQGAEDAVTPSIEEPLKKKTRKSSKVATVPTPSTSDNEANATKHRPKRSGRINYQEQDLSE
jgi:hypothetical protein